MVYASLPLRMALIEYFDKEYFTKQLDAMTWPLLLAHVYERVVLLCWISRRISIRAFIVRSFLLNVLGVLLSFLIHTRENFTYAARHSLTGH